MVSNHGVDSACGQDYCSLVCVVGCRNKKREINEKSMKISKWVPFKFYQKASSDFVHIVCLTVSSQ